MKTWPAEDRSGPAKSGTSVAIIAGFILICIGLLMVAFLYYQGSGGSDWNIVDARSCTFADTARNICRGKGFSTNIIWPLSLAYSKNIDHFPDLYNPPLYSVILAVFFKLFGTGDGSILVCTTVLYLATIALLFTFAREIFGLGVAFLTGLLFTVNRIMVANVLQGSDTVLLVFLMTATLYAIYKKGIEDRRGNIAIGALLGLCTLTFYPLGLLLLPLIGYGFFIGGREQERCAGALAGGFLAVTVLWFIRNAVVSGNPFISLSWTTTRYFPFDFAVPAVTADTLQAKASFSLEDLMRTLFRYKVLTIFGTFIFPFFIIAAFKRPQDKQLGTTRNIVYIFLLTIWALQSIARGTDIRFFLPFLPFVLLVVCGYVCTTIETNAPRRPIFKYGIIAVFVLLNLQTSSMSSARVRVGPNYFNAAVQKNRLHVLPENAVVMTAFPQFMAWYIGRKAMPITKSAKDIEQVKDIIGDRFAVYLDEDFSNHDIFVPPWVGILKAARKGYNPKVLTLSRGVGFQGRVDFLFFEEGTAAAETGL